VGRFLHHQRHSSGRWYLHSDGRVETTGSKFDVSCISVGEWRGISYRTDFASAPLFARCDYCSPPFLADRELVLLCSVCGWGPNLGSRCCFGCRWSGTYGLSFGVASDKETIAKLRQVDNGALKDKLSPSLRTPRRSFCALGFSVSEKSPS